MHLISDWRQLPFREIWIVDTEFYPGPGKANGGVDGDPITPLCLVALEMRSNRVIRLWLLGQPLAGGLALVEPGPGMLVAFNAAPGTIAPRKRGLMEPTPKRLPR